MCVLTVHASCPVLSDDKGKQQSLAFHSKAITASFRSRIIRRSSYFPSPQADGEGEHLHTLCPVDALCCYVEHIVLSKTPTNCFSAMVV